MFALAERTDELCAVFFDLAAATERQPLDVVYAPDHAL